MTLNFTLNLTQGVFIGRIYRISHIETLKFQRTNISHLRFS